MCHLASSSLLLFDPSFLSPLLSPISLSSHHCQEPVLNFTAPKEREEQRMGSLGGEVAARNKAMWLYPKMMGANPSERWGHSASYFNGFLYIFGGCRGGVHFSDVLVCNLGTMTWNILKTSGQGPGPRDSHSAVVVGHKMLVFGGTNGCKKVNDLHILDLLSTQWTQPECHGTPPCARESHTINVVSDEKLVVFGGSGEGEANYLNDLHILDLKKMEWSSPDVRGIVPAPRDSHSSVVVGNLFFVFGGDSGDRYQGDVSVLDMNMMLWSKLDACGPSPGARAGHAAVSIGTKVYILGGVGDKQYYSDIWVLDVITSSWVQLDINSRKSQGRFSHTATVTNLGIAVFGGCGEDERPLNELLILQIDSLTCRDFVNGYKDNNLRKTILVGDNEDSALQEVEELDFVTKKSFCFSSDTLHPKRRRTSNSKLPEKIQELDEHSPSQSDHEHTPLKRSIGSFSRVHPFSRPTICYQLTSENPNQIKQQRNMICNEAELPSLEAGKTRNLIGAEVRGQVDGAFDSGYLMTATVNGRVFRGVLFAPGPDVISRGTTVQSHPVVGYPRQHLVKVIDRGSCHSSEQAQTRRSPPENRASLSVGKDRSRTNSELQDVVLTLASPGIDHVGFRDHLK